MQFVSDLSCCSCLMMSWECERRRGRGYGHRRVEPCQRKLREVAGVEEEYDKIKPTVL